MPNLANHNVKYQQLSAKFICYGFCLSPIVLVIMVFLSRLSWSYALICMVLVVIGGCFYYNLFYVNIKPMVHEVWGNGTHLLIKKDDKELRLDFDDINYVEYHLNLRLNANYAIQIHLNKDSIFGNPICFISWADTINYGREFHLFPTKTPEMLAWIEKINKKSGHTNDSS